MFLLTISLDCVILYCACWLHKHASADWSATDWLTHTY